MKFSKIEHFRKGVLIFAPLFCVISQFVFADLAAHATQAPAQDGADTAAALATLTCAEWIASSPVEKSNRPIADDTCRTALKTGTKAVRAEILDAYLLNDGQFLNPLMLRDVDGALTSPIRLKLKAVEAQSARRADVDLGMAEIDGLITQAEERNDLVSLAALHFAASTMLLMNGDVDGMGRHASDALDIAENAQMIRLLPKILNSYAVSANIKGDYPTAIDAYERAIAAAETVGDEYRIANITANIGNIFSDLGDGDAAMSYYESALSLARKIDTADPTLLAGLLTNIGTIHTLEGRHEQAVAVFEEATPINQAGPRRDLDGLLSFFNGQSLYALGERERGFALVEQSVEETLKFRDPTEAPTRLNWMAERRLEQGDPEGARAYLERGRQIMEPDGAGAQSLLENKDNVFWTMEYAEGLSRVLAALGQRDEALEYAQVAMQLSEDRFEKEKTEAAVNTELLFNLREREADLKSTEQRALLETRERMLAEERAKLAELSAERFALLSLVTVFATLAMGATVYAVWRSYKNQRAMANAKDTFLSEMHHRVGNNFQLIVSLLSIDARRIDIKRAAIAKKTGMEPDPDQSHAEAVNRVRTMALVHNHLYGARQTTTACAQEFLEELVDLLRTSMGRPGVTVHAEVEAMDMDVDSLTPLGLLVGEAVTNAYKHAFTNGGGQICVRLVRGDDGATLTVEDNGRGSIAKRAAKKENAGLGADLMQELATQLTAQFDVASSKNGTTVTVTCIPIRRYTKGALSSATDGVKDQNREELNDLISGSGLGKA